MLTITKYQYVFQRNELHKILLREIKYNILLYYIKHKILLYYKQKNIGF
jgi:hypothetical protein